MYRPAVMAAKDMQNGLIDHRFDTMDFVVFSYVVRLKTINVRIL